MEIEPTPETESVPEAPSFGPGLRPVSIVPNAGREPAPDLSDSDALAAWVAVTAPWHPAILAKSEALPRVEEVDTPSDPEPRDLRLVAAGASGRLDGVHRDRALEVGATIVEASQDRDATIAALTGSAEISIGETGPDLAELVPDFLALGAARQWLDDLTIAMGHADGLDLAALTREALGGARAWAEGDAPAAKNRLRAAFEVLTEARERFYPVDAHLVDLTLLDPASRPEELDDALAARNTFTLMAPAIVIEGLARRDPDRLAALRTAIDEGWADLIGGAYSEADEPLLPLNSILWQFRKATETYREHLDGRNVETLARRRFGLYPQLPQIAKRFGHRFGLHLGFDAGRFPIRPEMKRLWESPDGTSLEVLNRPPIAADRPSEGARFPWRLARSMKDDFTAAIPVIHWAGRVAAWYRDLRRASTYSPVFMRMTTVNDFFHLTDRPFDSFRVTPDEYTPPYLDQAIRRADPAPISGRADRARLRARFDAIETTAALASALGQEAVGSLREVEDAVESGPIPEATARLDAVQAHWAEAAARGIAGEGTDGRAGYLIVNPVGVARRVSVLLPDATLDLRPEGPLRAAQFTEDGVWAVVDLAAFGYAWVPAATATLAPMAPVDALSIRDRTMANEAMSVVLDAATGGIRGIHGPDEATARLGQQLVIVGLTGKDGKPAISTMREEGFDVEYGGPALAQATTRGTIHHPSDDRILARYAQRVRLWTGRPALEIDVTLSDLDPSWLASLETSDPWSNYLASRWAWPDGESTLRRTSLLHSEPTAVDRPETPDAIEVISRRRKTTLLFGGLAHHRRIRPRMLDTLLIAGRETARTFRLGAALDLEHPWQPSLDALAPAFVVPTRTGPPKTGPAGWLIAVDSKAVAVTGVSFLEHSGDGRGWGLAVTLLETSGRATRCKLRTFRDPVWARQLDFQDELIVDLSVDGDGTLVDLTPNELARVDLTLG